MARWQKGIEVRHAHSYAWLNLRSAGRALRNGIAVYSLILMAQNTQGSAEARKSLEHVKAWIDVMRPLKTCSLWLNSRGSQFDLQFKLGDETGG